MSLKPCRDCGHEVSAEAPNCPNCGCVLPGHAKSHTSGWLFILLLVGVIAALVRSYAMQHGA